MMIYNKTTGTIKLKSTTDKSTYCAACQVQVCVSLFLRRSRPFPPFCAEKKTKTRSEACGQQRSGNDKCKAVTVWGVSGLENILRIWREGGGGRREEDASTAARIQAVSGFKWQEKSPCHGSMMNHYGRVTSTGGGRKAHRTQGPEGARTEFKER